MSSAPSIPAEPLLDADLVPPTAEATLHPPRENGIVVRRFAGAAAHAQKLDDLRVAHLTDQHVGRVTPMRAQRAAVELTNAQAPDLVVITGDFVCHSQLYLDQLEEVIGAFHAPVMAVLGNHDYWSGAGEVRRALRRGGAELLDNAHTTITLRRQTLQVVGLDDAYTGHADAARATRGLRPDLPTIGLSHIAEEADKLWRRGVPLVFSGHTHAGQVTLARLHELSIGKIGGHRYVHGLYGRRDPGGEEGVGAVYVGAGIGAAVLPLRLGERGKREIAIFELGARTGSFAEPHAEQPAHPGRKPSHRKRYKRAVAVVKKHGKRARKADKLAVSRGRRGAGGEARGAGDVREGASSGVLEPIAALRRKPA